MGQALMVLFFIFALSITILRIVILQFAPTLLDSIKAYLDLNTCDANSPFTW